MPAATVTFYGHSAFGIRTGQGVSVLIDPWMENPQAPEGAKNIKADLVLVTHAHGDHLGNCITIGRSPSTEIVAIHEIQQYLLSRGLPNVTGMNIGGTYVTKGVSITMVPAIHSSSIQEGNLFLYGGEAAGFIVGLAEGLSVYHAGDTALFGDMALIGELYRPRVVMLPIGSHYVMGPREAAHAVRLLMPEMVIPMHYGTFPALTGTVDAFMREVNTLKLDVEVVPLSPGEFIELI